MSLIDDAKLITSRDRYAHNNEQAMAAQRVVKAYLRELDDTPVTAEWLEAVFPTYGCGEVRMSHNFITVTETGMKIIHWGNGGNWGPVMIEAETRSGETITLLKNPTRGEVRSLCRVLKVQLRETANV